MGRMKREQDTRELDEIGSEAVATDRRKFLRKSLGAVPIVLTVGNRPGWGGHSVHGTLWSSGGTDWRHRGGGWWRDKAPHVGDYRKPQEGGGYDGEPSTLPEWEWQNSRVEWRKWRPGDDEARDSDSRSPNWQWQKWRPGTEETQKWRENEREAPKPQDIPVAPIDETIRPKD